MSRARRSSISYDRDARPGARRRRGRREPKAATARASNIARTLREEDARAGVDADETSYAARLPALVERAGAILDRALNDEEGHDVRTAGAESLDDFASTIARPRAGDGMIRAKAAIKKKALQDLLKALPAMGVKHSRGAVPAEHRAATSWFAGVPMERLKTSIDSVRTRPTPWRRRTRITTARWRACNDSGAREVNTTQT